MIKIISDSSTLYTVSEAKDKGFYSVPLHVTIGDDSYRDLEDINSEQLLKMIEKLLYMMNYQKIMKLSISQWLVV